MEQFVEGEILFREGDPANRVGVIQNGKVIVQKDADSGAVVIGHASDGDFLGEMAVLESRTHGASAIAETEGQIVWITPDAFLRRISEDNTLAYRLMLRLSQRLSVLDHAYAQLAAPEETAPVRDAPAVSPAVEFSAEAAPVALLRAVLVPTRKGVARAMGISRIDIDTFPYVVGRHATVEEHSAPHRVDLLIEDVEPFRLSREHFAIVARDNGLAVEDRRSHLGTVVNGVAIGTYCKSDSAPLVNGLNRIVAGGGHSRYEFEVTVSTA